jgi:hypothetical protein
MADDDEEKSETKEPEFKEKSRRWILHRHFTGIPKEKRELLDYLEQYWKNEDKNKPVVGYRDLPERVFRRFLFNKEKVERLTPDDAIWNEKTDTKFADAFFIIILTMRNRRHWWIKEDRAYDKNLPRNLRAVLKHWAKQVTDILEPDALSNTIYRMNKINYLALAVSNIERARRLRLSESSTNINNTVVLQLLDASEKYCKLGIAGNKTGQVYLCENEYLGEVIQLQRNLSRARTSDHEQTIKSAEEFISKIEELIERNNSRYLKIMKWWQLYLIYRSNMTTNNKKSADTRREEMNKLENDKKDRNYLKSLFEKNPKNEEDEKSDNVLRNVLRSLGRYYAARKGELAWKSSWKNSQMQKKSDKDIPYENRQMKRKWVSEHQKNTTILYSIIHSGLPVNTQTERKFLKTPSRKDFSNPHLKVKRITRQISAIHEAIELIVARENQLAPIQMLFLLHDFMYRIEDEFSLLCRKKKKPLKDIKSWLEDHACVVFIQVLKRFKLEIVDNDNGFGLPDELDEAITFWISKLEMVNKNSDLDYKEKCNEIADIFTIAIYGDITEKKYTYNERGNYLPLYYGTSDDDVRKEFKIIPPESKIAGEGTANTLR